MLPRLLGLGSNWERPPDDIWFSRDIQQGLLQRWTIASKFLNIKLRRQPNGSYDLKCDSVPGWTPEVENRNVTRKGRVVSYGYDRWVLTRIGYTRLKKRDIQLHFDRTRSHYPLHLSFTQTQEFLAQFVAQILDRPDLDWRWFEDNIDTARQSVPQLPPPPARIEEAFLEQQRTRGETIQAGRLAMQMGVQNQINQQNMMVNQQLMTANR